MITPPIPPGGGLGFINAAAAVVLDSILIKPQRAIGPLVAQVTIEETHDDELEITEHPVEQGASIADHAFKRGARLRIRCAWSNSPSTPGLVDGVIGGLKATVSGVQDLLSGNSKSKVTDFYDKLLQLQVSRVPFDVFTGKRAYKNMLVKAISTTTDRDTENSLVVTVTLQQVIIVSTQLISVNAPASDQAAPESTQAPTNSGSQSLVPSAKFNSAGGGRGFVNPPTVN